MIRMTQRSYVWMAWGLVLAAMTAASAQDSTSPPQLSNDPAVVRPQTATRTAQGAKDQQPTATQAQQQQQSETPDSLNTSQELPNDPGASRLQTATGTAQGANGQQSAGAQAEQQQQQQNQTPSPVGTAAAPEPPAVAGVAASKPAGAVIAPAKQRRSRMFFIKLSAIVGGAAAIGTVAALSSRSPSKPPGSH